MAEIGKQEFNPLEAQIAVDTLERYSGSEASAFQPYLLLTNFPKYVAHFAAVRNLPVLTGSAFSVAHSPDEHISILDFKIGSPSAALIIDLCAHLPIKTALLLGMCGGLMDNVSFHLFQYMIRQTFPHSQRQFEWFLNKLLFLVHQLHSILL